MYSHRFVCEEPQERYEILQATHRREEVETRSPTIEGSQKCNEEKSMHTQVTFPFVGTVKHVEKCIAILMYTQYLNVGQVKHFNHNAFVAGS